MDNAGSVQDHNKFIREAFQAVLPSEERLQGISEAIALVESIQPGQALLPYWRARLEEEKAVGTPGERVLRWRPVVEEFQAATDGKILRDGEARLGKALLESGDSDAAVEHLGLALTEYHQKLFASRSTDDDRDIAQMSDWEYGVTRTLGCAEAQSIDADRFLLGIDRLVQLDEVHNALGRDTESPLEDAAAAIDEMLSDPLDDGVRLDSLIDRLVQECENPECSALHFARFRLPENVSHRAVVACARRNAPTDIQYSVKLACLLAAQKSVPATDLLRQLILPADGAAGADVAGDSSAVKARLAFGKRRFQDAREELLLAMTSATAQDELRYQYWIGQCERHLRNWGAALASFTRVSEAADPLLAAWATYRIAQCRSTLESSAHWFALSDDSLKCASTQIITSFNIVPQSRRIRLARGVLALAEGQPEAAATYLSEIPSGYRHYRVAQWARCLALLHLGRGEDARLALQPAEEPAEPTGWSIPRSRAAELLHRCEDVAAPEPIASLVYEEIAPDLEAEPEAWLDFFCWAAIDHKYARGALMRCVSAALDIGFSRILSDDVIARIVDIADLVADQLGEG